MSLDRLAETDLLLRTDYCNTRRTRPHDEIRPVPLRASDLRVAAARRPVRHQSRQSQTTHARPASRGDISETEINHSQSRTQKVPVLIARYCSVMPESHLVNGHHVCCSGSRVCVSDGDHRLVQSNDIIVAIIQHDGREFLRRLPRRSVRVVRRTGVFQQRSGESVYVQAIFGSVCQSRNEKQHGWSRSVVGQRVHRTILVDGKVRMYSLAWI